LEINAQDLLEAVQQHGGQPLLEVIVAKAQIIALARDNKRQAEELAQLREQHGNDPKTAD
jgi:uncharacterized protein HemY